MKGRNGNFGKNNQGFRSEKKTRGLIRGLNSVMINNVEDLKKLKKDEIGIVAKVGNKRKIEIAEHAIRSNIRLANLNSKKFIDFKNCAFIFVLIN